YGRGVWQLNPTAGGIVEVALPARPRGNSARGGIELPHPAAVGPDHQARAVLGNADVGDLDEGKPEIAGEGRSVIGRLVEADEGADVEHVGIVRISFQALDGDVGQRSASGHRLPA